MPLPSGGKFRFKKGSNVRLHSNKGGDVDEVKKVGKGKGKKKSKRGGGKGPTTGNMQADALRSGSY